MTVLTKKKKKIMLYPPWPADYRFFGMKLYKTFIILVHNSRSFLFHPNDELKIFKAFLFTLAKLWMEIFVFMLSGFEFRILQILEISSVMESLLHICEWVLY